MHHKLKARKPLILIFHSLGTHQELFEIGLSLILAKPIHYRVIISFKDIEVCIVIVWMT